MAHPSIIAGSADLQDLVGFLSELHALHVELFLHQQGLDTMTPAGKDAVFDNVLPLEEIATEDKGPGIRDAPML